VDSCRLPTLRYINCEYTSVETLVFLQGMSVVIKYALYIGFTALLIGCGGGGSNSVDESGNQNSTSVNFEPYTGVWTSDACEDREKIGIIITEDAIRSGRVQYSDFNCSSLSDNGLNQIRQSSVVGNSGSISSITTQTMPSGIEAISLTASSTAHMAFMFLDDRDKLYISDTGYEDDVNYDNPYSKILRDYSEDLRSMEGSYKTACIAGDSRSGFWGRGGDGYYYIEFVEISPNENYEYTVELYRYRDNACGGARELAYADRFPILFAHGDIDTTQGDGMLVSYLGLNQVASTRRVFVRAGNGYIRRSNNITSMQTDTSLHNEFMLMPE